MYYFVLKCYFIFNFSDFILKFKTKSDKINSALN